MGEEASSANSMDIDMDIMEPNPCNLSDSITIGATTSNSLISNDDRVSQYHQNYLGHNNLLEKFYDCNICLDLAKNPVVTCCGHLFCWPCLYKWLCLRSRLSQTLECPVCKGEVTYKNVIPIYGGGNDYEDSNSILEIPRRPNARRVSKVSNVKVSNVRFRRGYIRVRRSNPEGPY